MNYTLNVKKIGKSQYGQWVIGIVTNGVVFYEGIFSMDKEYDLVVDKVYSIKCISIKQNKLNKLAIKIELK